MPPNIPLYWIKRFFRAKQKPLFGNKVRDYKDGSGLQFIKFDFVTGGEETEIAIRVKKFDLFSRYFSSLVNMSLRSSLSAIFSSYFQHNKASLR